MNNTNPLTEISMLILAILLIVAGSLLLYVGKIGYDAAIFFFISALGLFGFNGALKAPSSMQAQQLNTQQQQQIAAVQELALNVANTQQSLLAQAHTHAEPVQAPVDTTTVVQPLVQPATQFISINRHFPGDSAVLPVVTPQ